MAQVPLPAVRCIRLGSVFLFPQLSCFNTTVHTHIGVFIRDIQSGEFDASKNWVFPKTPLPWSITEGHGCWVHSCWSHWREHSFRCFCMCSGVYGSQILLIFQDSGAWKYNTPQWAQYTTGVEESSSLNHRFGCSVAGIWWVASDGWMQLSLWVISDLM